MERILVDWIEADLRASARAVWGSVLGYLVLVAGVHWLGRDELNPDLVAYVELARHYARGEFGLAISSWWSPMFSWLIVPGLGLGLDPVKWAAGVQSLAGLGLAGATVALVREFQGRSGSGTLAAFQLGLVVAVLIQTGLVNADLSQAVVLTVYWLFALRWLREGGWKAALAAGGVGGFAYLTKSYSLPYVVAHLTFTAGLKWIGTSRQPLGRVLWQGALALVGVAALAGPWIAVLSRNDGEFMINCAGKYWTFTQPLDSGQVPECHRLNRVREGRLTAIENMREMAGAWRKAPPFGGTVRDRVKVVSTNARMLREAFASLDGWGVSMALLVFAVLTLVPFRSAWVDPVRLPVVWGLVSVAIYAGGYLLVFFTERYLWSLWGLMVALAVGVPRVGMVRFGWPARGGVVGAAGTVPAARLARVWHALFLVGLGGLALATAGANLAYRASSSAGRMAHEVRRVAAQFPTDRTLVSPDWYNGLYLAYRTRNVYSGRVLGKTPADIAAEVEPFGAVTVVVFGDDTMRQALAASPQFRKVGAEDPVVAAFDVVPGAVRP